MATSTFERKIELNTVDSVKKLIAVASEDVSNRPLSKTPFSTNERIRSEKLLKQFLSHSK